LLEKVINLGQLGEVVKVREGYARNFLIPQGKAKRATQANLAEFEKASRRARKAQAEALTAAQERAAKLDGLMVQITQKAGVDGKLFGSVTNSDIADALKAQGFDVPKAAIRMPAGRSSKSATSSSRSHCTPTWWSRSPSPCSARPLSDSIETEIFSMKKGLATALFF